MKKQLSIITACLFLSGCGGFAHLPETVDCLEQRKKVVSLTFCRDYNHFTQREAVQACVAQMDLSPRAQVELVNSQMRSLVKQCKGAKQ